MFVILCADSQLDSNIELDSYGVPAVDAGGIKTNDGSAYHDIAQGGDQGGRISIRRLAVQTFTTSASTQSIGSETARSSVWILWTVVCSAQ